MVVLVLSGFPLFARANVTEDREIKTLEIPDDGRAKLGLLLGYPSGLTFGYRPSNWFELNATVGYSLRFSESAIVSANGLFTLVNIPVGSAGVIPLSLGPQVNFILGNNLFYMEMVADLRFEYTFPDIPLNLFVETGFGLRFFEGTQNLAGLERWCRNPLCFLEACRLPCCRITLTEVIYRYARDNQRAIRPPCHD